MADAEGSFECGEGEGGVEPEDDARKSATERMVLSAAWRRGWPVDVLVSWPRNGVNSWVASLSSLSYGTGTCAAIGNYRVPASIISNQYG